MWILRMASMKRRWVFACVLFVSALMIYFRTQLLTQPWGAVVKGQQQNHDTRNSSTSVPRNGRGVAGGKGGGTGGKARGGRGTGQSQKPKPLPRKRKPGEKMTLPSRDPLEIDYMRLANAFGGDHIDFKNMMEFRLREDQLAEAEKDALQAVIFANIDLEPSRETSRLHLVHGNETDPDNFNNFTVRLDLYDARGRQVRYGGHQVRMWITSVPPVKKSAALRVTDLRNGSYVSSFPALWPGKTVVHAAMVFSRDLHYVMSKTIVKLKNPQPLVGGFVRGDCKEATLCGPFPVIPGYPASCNHTSMNSGLGWYCGKPKKTCLSCEDLKFARRFKLRGFPRPLQTAAERALYTWFTKETKVWKFNMNQTLTVVSDAKPPPEPSTPCSAMKSRDTWNDQSPHGFMDRNKWNSLVCALPPWKVNSFSDCFRGATFWFIGDSNARMMFEAMCGLVHGDVDQTVVFSHIPLNCSNIKRGLDVKAEWFPHEYPFQGGDRFWYDMSVKKSPRHYMNRIPPTGKYFVLVHLYAHFVNYPSAVHREHVRDVARGARDLCQRNPSAKVVVRGPSCWTNEVRGDYLTTLLREVLTRKFREVQDCVIYLDAWDVTLCAGGCINVHPPQFATRELTRTFLGHVC